MTSNLERFISNLCCNSCQGFYDMYVEANVRFRSAAGMKMVIIRRQLGNCCDWCKNLAGIYSPWNAPKDIYRRHSNCRCLVTTRTEKGYQDVWNKKMFQTQREARINRFKELQEQSAQQALLRIPEVAASKITQMIREGKIRLKLSKQAYNNHVLGTKDYDRKMNSRRAKGYNPQSILTISYEETQEIIKKYSGTGIIKTNKNGRIITVEKITCDRVIGKYCSKGVWYDTNKAQIHYNREGSHLVPIRGSNYD